MEAVNNNGEELIGTLSDRYELKTDLLLSAAGLAANAGIAEKIDLDTDKRIAVNNDMQTSDPDIYSIGDCASLEGEVFAYIEPIRRQAEAIAASIVGEHERFMPLSSLIKVQPPQFH